MDGLYCRLTEMPIISMKKPLMDNLSVKDGKRMQTQGKRRIGEALAEAIRLYRAAFIGSPE